MAAKSGSSLDYWRNYFRAANSDIFDIIEKAISVAATDCPKEFRVRRDRIAEHLFSCKLPRCSGCDQVKEEGDDARKPCFDTGSKESKVNSCGDDDHGEMNVNQVSNYSYGEAEALTDEIEEASQIVEEVLRIKEILDDSQYQSEQLLFDSLRKLQLMALSVDILKSTEIGKAVNGLRKHGSKRVCHLARDLIDLWKEMVDEWVNATKALAGTPESANPSVVDDDEEEGLPSPPMDDFFATQPTAIELSQFFDGMDDDGNPRISGEFNKNRGNGRKPSSDIARRRQQSSNEVNVHHPSQQMKKQEANVRPNKPSNTQSGPGRPPKVDMERRSSNEMKLQHKSDKSALQRRPLGGQQDCSDEVAKLEATKRKLQERYQQAEIAKRQRTIQVMELHDIPKQGLGHRNPHVRPGNHGRPRANGRR